MESREIFNTHRETWRSARKPGDSRVNRETWQLWHLYLESLDLFGHADQLMVQLKFPPKTRLNR